MKRTPIRRFSAKKLAQLTLRHECIKAVIERDQVCQFPIRNAAWCAEYGIPPSYQLVECDGAFEVHEPAKRSHGADPTNPDECVLLCQAHHRLCHEQPVVGEALGLLYRNGRPVERAQS